MIDLVLDRRLFRELADGDRFLAGSSEFLRRDESTAVSPYGWVYQIDPNASVIVLPKRSLSELDPIKHEKPTSVQ